jgi:hypothetical protein
MANQGFRQIFSWCETPPGSTKEVECACVPIHNASKLQGLPIDPDLESICNAGDVLVFDGTEWVCSATGPTGCDCESATGFFSPTDCTFNIGTGFFINGDSVYTRINNVNTVRYFLSIGNVTTAGNDNRELQITCNFPSLPPHDTGLNTPGAIGAFALATDNPTSISGIVLEGTTTSVVLLLFTGTALVGGDNDDVEVQATYSYVG